MVPRFWLLALLALIAAGCLAPVAPGATQAPAAPAGDATPVLRVALLPITDVVPFYVAEQENYFGASGLQAEAVPVNSAADRETMLQTGAADCEMTDIHGVVLANAGGAQPLRIIATARQASADLPLFFLLSAPESGITAPEQLAQANISISENTIIDYWTDRILAAAEVDPAGITHTNAPQIPVRLELLMKNQVDAAVLPDPFASLAMMQGAHAVLDDTLNPEIAVSVLACRADMIAEQREAVRLFLAGWDQAVESINADPAAYSNVLLKNTRVPEPLQDKYTLPPFPVKQIPSEAQIQDVVDWMVEKGMIDAPLTYDQVVDPSFRR